MGDETLNTRPMRRSRIPPVQNPKPKIQNLRSRGFSLIELAIVISVLGIVAGLGAGILVEGGRALTHARSRNDGFTDGRYALSRLDIDVAGLANRDQVTTMGAHSITLDISGSSLTYALSGTNLLRGGKVLARDVSEFNLIYYQSNGALATAPANLHRIAAELTITRGGTPAPLRTEMFPRTFRASYVPPGEESTDTGTNGHGGRRWWWHGRLWRWTRHRHW